MANFDGEYELRFFYTVTVASIPVEHRHTFDIAVDGNPAPGSEFSEITVIKRSGVTLPLDEWVEQYLPHLRLMFDTTADLIRAELWYAEEATEDFVFIAVEPLGVVGTGTGAAVVAQQWTATYRTVDGGVGRIQLMEGVTSGNSLQSFPTSGSNSNAIMAFLVGLEGIMLGRDNSRPVVANKLGLGQNEKLYRRRFRQGI